MRIERLERVEAFITKDGSEIRELAGVPTGNSQNQSLAEATVAPGGETEEHYHRLSEEIYFFTAGGGRLRLGDEESEVARRRHRRDPARHPAQALEHRQRAAEAAVLLLTAVLARRHVPNRVADVPQTRYAGGALRRPPGSRSPPLARPPTEDERAGSLMDTQASRQPLGIEDERSGLMLVELSNAMVRLYKELFGRGPTKARDALRRPRPDRLLARVQPHSHRTQHGRRG